jgi:23S rRNA pseudouridine2605 synthase
MAKRNTSNRSRKDSSSSQSGPRKSSFNKKTGERPSKGPDKGGSEKRFTKNRDENSFDSKRRSRPSAGPSAYKKGNRSASTSKEEKPYKKFPSDSKRRPYKKFESRTSGDTDSSKKEITRESPLKRPYKKFDEPAKSFAEKKFSSSRFSGKKPSFKKTGNKGKVSLDIEAPAQTGKVRLNKFIANSGVCSRREADELITMGVISVNGKTITELGYKVNPGDVVRHENKILKAEKPIYILLNKPKGFLTTTSDPQERNTVMHLIGNAVKERVYPVGRLDRNTTGLLLLTNDGDLADKLMHPSYNAKKIYKVELDRPLTKADAQLILDGVQLEEGKAMVDDLAVISDDKRTVGIELHIGWNRVVRRIFEALNYEVLKLDRSVYAGLDKKDLGRGEWRFLTREELVRLKHYK